MSRFWMVYGMQQGAPTVRHDSREAAEREARRLAAMNAGVSFFVLETVSRAVKVDVRLERLDQPEFNDDDIPF